MARLDVDLENEVKQCLMCQRACKMPPNSPIQTWDWPEKPWTSIHVDHAAPIQGTTVLVIVDAHSKWIDAHIAPSTFFTATISKLRSTFATHKLPEVILSDNGPAFTSCEFQQFVQANGMIMRHMTSAPYHPASNGLAERAVQTLKEGIVSESEGNTMVKVQLDDRRMWWHHVDHIIVTEIDLNK